MTTFETIYVVINLFILMATFISIIVELLLELFRVNKK